MAGNRLDDIRGLFPLFYQVGADGGVRAFDLMVHRFTDIVQQAGFLGGGYVGAQFRGNHPRQVGRLDAVGQHILPVAGAVLETPDQLD